MSRMRDDDPTSNHLFCILLFIRLTIPFLLINYQVSGSTSKNSTHTASMAAAALRKSNERLRQAEKLKHAMMNAAFDPE